MGGELRRERAVVVIALAVVALHVLVEALVAPELGTFWRDHLIPTLVPLLVLAGAAVVVRRARPGLVATVGLVVGSWALVGAALGAVDLADGRVRADAASGGLLGVAGTALVVVGLHVLWRARHRRGRWRARRVAQGVLAALVAFWVVVPVSIALVATHRPRGTADPPDLGPTATAVALRTDDGLTLQATYLPSANGAAIVLLPERAGSAAHARLLARHGYGVLAVDVRGYGTSEGDPNALGWGAGPDVDAAIAFLAGRPEVRDGRIGGLGLSVGGELLLEAAARNQDIHAVVSDGAGERSLRESITRGRAAALMLPLQAVQTVAVAILSGDAPPEGLHELVGRIAPRPVLLVAAGKGGGGEELNRLYAERAGPSTALWELPEAAHLGGIRVRPAAYERRIVAFLDRALGVER